MEALLTTTIGKVAAIGGSYLVMAIFMILYWLERKESAKLGEQMLTMSKDQITVSVKTEAVLGQINETLKELSRSRRP